MSQESALYQPARRNDLKSRPAPRPGQEDPDWALLAVVLTMLGLGLVMILSSSIMAGETLRHDPYFFFKRQLLFAVLGLGCLGAIVWVFPRRLIEGLQYPFLGICMFMLILCLVLAPEQASRAKRWLPPFLGVSLQPMEFTKIALVCYLAYFLGAKQHLVKTFKRGLLPLFIVTGTICLLLLRQPDFGGAAVISMLLFFMCLAGGASRFYLFLTGLLAAGGGWLLIVTFPYRMLRLEIFKDPFSNPEKSAQIIQSFLALSSGGITGAGPGMGRAKFDYVPEIHTDFIMAALGEELGFLGISLICILILLLVWRGLHIAMRQEDLRGRLTAFGLTLVLAIPMLLNLAVVSATIPAKGVAMPFFSYGGSSLISSLVCAGLLLKYSRYARKRSKDAA
ncbi:MAG: putative lipid II flippase FtsW [Desulfovibrionaceae bacterium]|nr:putative lipid II flippase FtsW [Desulfovibrionaceae bacterium]